MFSGSYSGSVLSRDVGGSRDEGGVREPSASSCEESSLRRLLSRSFSGLSGVLSLGLLEGDSIAKKQQQQNVGKSGVFSEE
eukprot:m.81363 g.81363  ORF g.81363 m.81363 type:complete len:81 (-) comp20973_c1_seq2:2-244(-)